MDSNVAFLCMDISRLFRKNFTSLSRETGATGGQWRALLFLERHAGVTQGAMADHLDVEPITACRMIDRLEQAGLVERRKDPSDRRVRQLFLTDAARPVVNELRAIGAHMLQSATASLSAQETELLLKLLERVRDNMINYPIDDASLEAVNG